MKVVSKRVMNAPSTKWSIVSNAPKPAICAEECRKMAKNNNNHPLSAMADITNKGDRS